MVKIFLFNIVNNKTANMNKPKNTHQVLYAKNLYQHTGDLIADMRKVCKLDQPDWNFSSPTQILKFMRQQYKIWLDNTPEVEKDLGAQVAWDDNPITAEMWCILSSYSSFIPMTMNHGYIQELPRYDVLKPQYNARMISMFDEVFTRKMTTEDLKKRADELLNMSSVEILDILADEIMRKFDFKKAAKIVNMFGGHVTPQDLDEELWNGYSDVIGYNLDEQGNLPERNYYKFTEHFEIEVLGMFKPNHTFGIEVHLTAAKMEYTHPVKVTEENFQDCVDQCVASIKTIYSGTFDKIVEVSQKLYEPNRNPYEVPCHVLNGPEQLKETFTEAADYNSTKFGRFNELKDEYASTYCAYGGFYVHLFNDNGYMRMVAAYNTLFECALHEHALYNRCIVSEPMY